MQPDGISTMDIKGIALAVFLAGIAIGITCASTAHDHARLHETLFENYKKFIRPVYNQSEALQVNISFFIIMIHDLDLKNQVLTTNAWLRVSWYDEFLSWDEEKYGGLHEVLVEKNEVWIPDLLVENTAYGYKELGISEMKINLDSRGLLIWEPGIVMSTVCEVSIAKYPFDKQHCAIRIMSWMHTNKMIHVHVENQKVDIKNYYPNGEWDLTDTLVREFYPDDGSYNDGEILPGAEAILMLRRKPTFYILSTVLPISLLSLLNLLVFLLPASTGEKMTLAVTVLLSYTVFMSVVNEIMPKTSSSVSILAVYLTFLLCMSGISVASTVWVLYVHHKEFIPRWSRHFQEVHETKFHRVLRPKDKSCNNNSDGTALKRPQTVTNGTCPSPSPSVNQRLLEMKETEATLDILDDAEDARDCAKRLCDIICDPGRQGSDGVRQHPSGKMDKILFWCVGILTAIATLTMLVLLTTE